MARKSRRIALLFGVVAAVIAATAAAQAQQVFRYVDKDGKVVVTCEFCSSVYQFTPHEAGVED